MKSKSHSSRRSFIKNTVLGAALVSTAPTIMSNSYSQRILLKSRDLEPSQFAANDQVQLALIGAGIQGIYDTTSALRVPGVKLVEAERNKRTGFCCGAGGGRMWMEEKIGKRINTTRFDQLAATGAKTLATACPYCMIMLDDAMKEKGAEEEFEVLDLAQMMLRSIE